MDRPPQELEREQISRAYSVQPVCVAGNLLAAAVVFVVGVTEDSDPRWWWWAGIHSVGSLWAIGMYLLFRHSTLVDSPVRARAALRLLPLATGVVWALGVFWWPMGSGEAGLAILLCTGGLAAAGSNAWAGDPLGLVLFMVPALTAHWLFADAGTWLPVAMVGYGAGIALITFRNQRLLRTALLLHHSNQSLLEQAIEERELARHAQHEAERAAVSKTRFLAAASHDLRQPVQAVALFADVLAQTPDGQRRTEAIQALVRSSQVLSHMLESLLDMARLDAGVASTHNRHHVPLLPVLYDTAASLADEAEPAGVTLSVAGPDCSAFVDPVPFTRVVQNLAANAVRYGSPGRVLLSLRRRGAEHCLLQVWDQGPGIESADQERIFEEFVQLANPERDRRKGLGLGLSLVHRICQVNGWPLQLRSVPGQGSVFSVLLPLGESNPGSRPPRRPARREWQVILVEDDVAVRDALASWLLEQGCLVQACTDGSAAIHAFERAEATGKGVDVLVTDHGLPGGMSGADLVAALRRRRADLPTVVLTGAVKEPLGVRPPPGVVVLRKPATGRVLWEAIQEVLGHVRKG